MDGSRVWLLSEGRSRRPKIEQNWLGRHHDSAGAGAGTAKTLKLMIQRRRASMVMQPLSSRRVRRGRQVSAWRVTRDGHMQIAPEKERVRVALCFVCKRRDGRLAIHGSCPFSRPWSWFPSRASKGALE